MDEFEDYARFLEDNRDKGRHGGKREGAGRKNGNKSRAAPAGMRGLTAAQAEDGISPMIFYWKVLNGRQIKLANGSWYKPTFDDQKWAAEKMAPYAHKKMPQDTRLDGSVDLTLRGLFEAVSGVTHGHLPSDFAKPTNAQIARSSGEQRAAAREIDGESEIMAVEA
jgi:hypothetical protein